MTTIGLSNNTPSNTDDAANAGQPPEPAANTARQLDETLGDKPRIGKAPADKGRSEKARADKARRNEAFDEAGKKRIPLLWIAATLGIGLFIAAVYLGSRIFTAHSFSNQAIAPEQPHKTAQIPPASPDSVPPQPAANNTPPAPASAVQLYPVQLDAVQNEPDDAVPMIAPHSGERYIQIGALDSAATRRFIRHLRNENLEPHVAPGPTPDLMRILIGPFDSTDALNERKAQLESEGIDTFVRQY